MNEEHQEAAASGDGMPEVPAPDHVDGESYDQSTASLQGGDPAAQPAPVAESDADAASANDELTLKVNVDTTEAQQKLAELGALIEVRSSDFAALEQRIASLTADAEARTSHIASIDAEITKLDAEVAEKTATIEQLSAKIADLEAKEHEFDAGDIAGDPTLTGRYIVRSGEQLHEFVGHILAKGRELFGNHSGLYRETVSTERTDVPATLIDPESQRG